MISETLGNIYTSMENKFYAFFDFLEEKGLPVYKIIDPIEGKGIPFFPLSIGIIAILLVAIIGFGVIGTGFESSIELNLKDSYGGGLSQVKITVTDATGKELLSEIKNNGDLIKIKVSGGTELTFKAEKTGYEENTTKIKVINEREEVNLNLKKLINTIQAKIKFYDEETKTSISAVYVELEGRNILLDGITDSTGLVEFLDIPLEEDIYISAKSDSYYDYTGSIRFESEETKSIYLTPKEISLEGESNLIITLFDQETGELLKNVKVKVYDALSNELIDEKIVEDGVYSENFPKGMVVRYTIEKDGYKLFESKEFTLRGEEENQGSIELEKGGKEVEVTVIYSDTGNPAVGAEVTLYNSSNQIVDSDYTLYEGTKIFKGLNKDENYFVGAGKEGYLPAIKLIENETETLELIKENTTNSSELTILVVDSDEKIIENASLYFTQFIEDQEIPLGLGVKKTDVEGKFKLNVPLNSEITVKAVKDLLQGQESITIGEYNNNLVIKLERRNSVKSIKFFDEQGQILGGHLLIKTKNGEILYDDEVIDELLFDAGEENYLEIELTTADGKKYSEELYVGEENDFEINIDSVLNQKDAPEIEFLGVFDLAGNEIEGITKGKEYILKFKTTWKQGTESGGLHFRTGSDSIKYADSEDIGITGFDAPTTKYFYGRSYSATPAPGNKEIDYSNRGQGGQYNKLIEMYFDKPEGTKIIKVRIKARELISQESVRIKYRGWTKNNGKNARTPIDEVLGEATNTKERQGLYAETEEIEIKVYDSEPKCMEEVCIEYNIIDSKGKLYEKKDFYALKGEIYALEMKLEARKTTEAKFKLSTSNENPRIGFTGKEIGSFSQFIDNDNSDTFIEFTETISRDGTKIRVYFKAKEEGESFVKSLITTPKDSLSENFYFKIFEEKEMQVQVQEKILEGKNFEITVKDETGKGIENAKIVFFNEKGRIETTIISDEIQGRNGIYSIENNFKAGKYLIKVEAPKYKEIEKEIQIVFGEGLEVTEEVTINIPTKETFASEKIRITNNTEETIENLSAEIIPTKNFPKEFKLSANPPNNLNPEEENEIEITVEYSGNANGILYGEAEIIFSGEIKGIPIQTKTKIKVNYNQKLNENCIEFDRKELKEYLIGAGGNSKTLELEVKNNCGMSIEFELEVVPVGHTDGEIEFSTGNVKIEKDEIKTVRIDALNKIQRNYSAQRTLEYTLYFKSSQMTKTIPIKIILWNELFSLSVSPQIVLWLTQSKEKQEAVTRQPIYIRNTGLADIQNLDYAIQFTKPGNIDVKILSGYSPEENIALLKKGMTVIPPAVIEATANTTENSRIIGRIIITGTINGKEYELRAIDVFINVSSGWSCLEAWGEDLFFSSENAEIGSIDKEIVITNNCTEPVIIKKIEPEKAGGNDLVLMNGNYTLNAGATDTAILRLIKSSETNQKTKVKVIGTGRNTGTEISSMPVEIELAIGKGTGICGSETEPCQGENETTLEYCDQEGTASFYFPKQSANCTDGYCDAEELGKFLAEKFEEQIRKAQLRIKEVKSVTNIGNKCDFRENYCSFGAMGISPIRFDFYLKNDNLTQNLLKKEIEKLESKELQNFILGVGENEGDLYGRAGNSFGEHLLLVPTTKGCGMYSAVIKGAVAIQGDEIRDNSITLLLEIEKGRKETPECLNHIQNFVNFIPIDKSYTPSTSQGTWLGTIYKDTELEELQKSFSKTLFKDEEGNRITSNKENNFIEFRQGGFDQTQGIVKIEMQKSGSSDSPKEIFVYITDNFFDAQEEVEKDIASEAGKIISNLKNGRVEKGCISSDESYLILGSVKDISEIANLQWKDDSKLINLYPETLSCIDLKLQSKIEAPETEVSWSLVDEQVSGIYPEQTVFKYKDGQEITNPGEKGFNLSKALWEEEGQGYSLEVQLCFMASATPRDAFGSKIKLEVSGLKERTLKFGVCAITPFEFVKRAEQKKDISNWYATVDWKEDYPEELPFAIAQLAYYSDNPKEDPNEERKNELAKRKTISLIGYGGGAFAGCLATGLIPGVGSMGMVNCLVNAGIPTTIGFLSAGSISETATQAYYNGLKSIGIKQEELKALKESTGMKNSDVFWEVEKVTAATGTATTSIRTLAAILKKAGIEAGQEVPPEVAQAAQAAEELSKVGAPELQKEFDELAELKSKYNSKVLEEMKKQRKGAPAENFPESGYDRKAIAKAAKTEGEKLIAKKNAFKEMVNNKIPKGPNGVDVLDGPGKKLLESTDEYVRRLDDQVASGKAPTSSIGKDAVRSSIAEPGAIDMKKEVEALAKKHPRLKKFGGAIGKGLIGTIGSMAGGTLGWMLTNAFMGDFQELPVPESTLEEGSFKKGFTYKVRVGNSQSGKTTYKYSEVAKEDLGNIKNGERLDNDSCEKGLQPLNLDEKQKELLKKINTEEKETEEAS